MVNKKIIIGSALLILVVAGGIYYLSTRQPKERQSFDFLIDWQAGPTYMGVYYAKHLGYFQKLGLDVNIIQSWGANPAVASVAGGKYLMSTASGGATVLGRNNSADVVSTAVLYHKITTVIYALASKNIYIPKDLEGKRIGIYPGSISANEFDAFVKINNLDRSKLKVVSLTGADIPLVLADQVDAVLTYAENSAVMIRLNNDLPVINGDKISEIKLADYGVGGYGLNVIINKDYLKNNASLARGISEAVINGYRAACKNKEDAVSSFAVEFPDLDVVFIKNGLDVVCQAITEPIGDQTQQGWQETVNLYNNLGLLSKPIDINSLYVK